MKPFSVDDIRDVFRSDLETFIHSTRQQLDRYLSPEGASEDFAECSRSAHSMKGVAAMVHAWGLAHFGEDLECLYQLAESLHVTQREQSRGIAGLIHAVIPQWEEMAQLTLEDRLDEAYSIYLRLRKSALKHYDDHLPKRDNPAGLVEKDAEPDFKKLKPATEVAGIARQVAVPKFRVESDPQETAKVRHTSVSSEVAGIARKATPPQLKIANTEPPAQLAETQVKPASDTAGVARLVSSPKFKIEDETPAAHGADKPEPAPTFTGADEELTAIFREEAAEYIQGLGVALGQLRTRDDDAIWAEVRRLCHTIKGSAAMVGLDDVSDKAKSAETTARAGEENKNSRGTKHVAKLIQAIEQCAKLLGIPFKLLVPAEASKAAKESSTAIDKDLAQAFVLDANDQLETLERALLAWEKGDNAEDQRHAAYRAYHTLKGAANSIGLGAVGAQIHHVEALLDSAGTGSVAQTKEMFTFLLTTVDHLRRFSTELNGNPDAHWALDWAQIVAALIAPTEAKPEPKPEHDFEGELLRAFALDARDQSQQLEQAILAWERNNNPAEQIQAAYRVFHTLKGAANSIGLQSVGTNFHAIESLLDRINLSGQLQPREEIVTFFLASVDELNKFAAEITRNSKAVWPHDWQAEAERLAALLGDGAESAESIAQPIAHDAAPAQVDYIRVEAARIRKLLNQVGEQVVERNRFGAKLTRAIQLRQLLSSNRQRLIRLVENFQDQFEYSSARARSGGGLNALRSILPLPNSSAIDDFSELELDRYDEYNMISRQLTEVADDLGQVTLELERLIDSFRTDEQRFASNSKVMQQDITTLTSQPIEGLFRRLDRIFRDAVQAEQKEATLRFEGAHATLDRNIIERLYTPLLHLVRNAVAHGIEAPEQREAAGKPREGTITISAAQSSNQIIITLRDNGRGVDAAKVLTRAKERGLIAADVAELAPEKVLEVLYAPGFSTAAEVTSIAGRGVGLDVVKKEIESMNGSLAMETTLGEGTVWRLQLPLSLAISEAVIVGLGTQEFAIPLNFVTSGLLLNTNRIFIRDGTEYYNVADEDLRLIRLARLFGQDEETLDPRGVILNVGDQRCLLLVDRVPARREIVVKGLDPLLARHAFLEGATLDADGLPVLILSAPALLRYAASVARIDSTKLPVRAARKVERNTGRLTVLVVDDSLSVRTVQDRLLGELGLEVILANDGLDALDKLRLREVDMIFTDLEMPRMNGYDLISTVRGNPNWADIPMVLVTSRAAQKHLDKAKQLGCNGFLIKPFTQQDLISQLSAHAAYEAHKAALK